MRCLPGQSQTLLLTSCLAGILYVACVRPARSADIEVLTPDKAGLPLIAVQGQFDIHDGERFAAIAASYPQAGVVFDSPGGSLIAGLQMGQIIRLRHYVTFVPEGLTCASACAIAWLAGTPRMMQDGSKIGFHSAFDQNTGEVTGAGNALVGAYLAKMGLSDEAIVFIEQAQPREMTWLTPADAANIGLRVEVVPADEPQSAVAPSPANPARMRPRSLPLTPALVEPRSTSGQGVSLEAEAKAFASDYFAHWSEANANALGYFAASYAPQVLFYGQMDERPHLLQEKREYTLRWPVRVYSVRPASLQAFCNTAKHVCAVSGIVDWDCRSPERRAHSIGSASFILTVALGQDAPQVIGEAGSVISRETN